MTAWSRPNDEVHTFPAFRMVTPARGAGLLPGILRADLLARRVITKARLTIDDLTRATRMWRINSLRGWTELDLGEFARTRLPSGP